MASWKDTPNYTEFRIKIYVKDFLHCLLSGNVEERRFSDKQLIGQHTDTPYINTVVITVPSNNLRADVIKRSTVSCSSIFANGRPSEIAKFGDILKIVITKKYVTHDNVLGLNVSMKNLVLMHML